MEKYQLSEKDKKKLKVRKVDTSSVKAAKPSESSTKSAIAPVSPKLKVKRASIPTSSLSSGPGKSTKTTKKAKGKSKATTGKVTYRKGGMTKSPKSDRMKAEIKTEQIGSEMVKKLRLKQRAKTYKKLKGYK